MATKGLKNAGDGKSRPPDPVQADRAYTSQQLCYAAGISMLCLRAMVRAGLPFTKVGGIRHFSGASWVEFVRKNEGRSIKTIDGIGRQDEPAT